MYDFVYIIYAFVKFLDEPPVNIYLSCHPERFKGLNKGHLESLMFGYLIVM